MDRGRGARGGGGGGRVQIDPESRLGEPSEQGPASLGLREEDAVTGLGVSGQTAIPWPYMKRTEVPN